MRKKLTNTVVESFTGDGKTLNPVLWDTELKGFGLRYAMRSGTRTYILQFRVRGQKNAQLVTIGRHNDPFRVDQARDEALKLKVTMLGGIDPVAQRRAAVAAAAERDKLDVAQTATLRQVMLHYVENKRTKHGPLRPRTKDSIKDVTERSLADWLDKPMAATITRDACVERFCELSDVETNIRTGGKGKKSTANLVFVYLRALCNYARDLYESEDGTPRVFVVNPVTRMIKVRKFNRAKPHTGRIPRDRIGHVYNALRQRAKDGRTDIIRSAADWLTLVLLTGTRLTESGALKKADIDLHKRTLTLRGEIDGGLGFHGTKNHHDLTLPLPTVLFEMLESRLTTSPSPTPTERRRHRERSSEYLFPSFGVKRPFLTDPRATLDLISEVAGVKISTHDLRRTFEDVLRYSKVDPDERRLLLNHISGDVHQVSYSNSEDHEALRPAMQAATDWILNQASIASSSNVVAFPTLMKAVG